MPHIIIIKKKYEDVTILKTYRLPGRCEWMCVPFNWSRDRDLGRVRRVLDATLCVGPCTEFVYDARDILSLGANDCRDWRNSKCYFCHCELNVEAFFFWTFELLPGLELTKLLGNADPKYPLCEWFEKLWCDWPSAMDLPLAKK